MDFGLTDEQDLLRATARQFVADMCPAEKAKQWDEEGVVPPELFRGMADPGWFSLPFAEEEGGDGGGPLELILIAEELGRASFDVAMCYIGVLIPGITVFRWGSEAQRDQANWSHVDLDAGSPENVRANRRGFRAHGALVELVAARRSEAAEELWRVHLQEAEDYLLRNRSMTTVLDLLG